MLLTMSDKEIQCLAVLQDVRDQRITQVRAAEILNLSFNLTLVILNVRISFRF